MDQVDIDSFGGEIVNNSRVVCMYMVYFISKRGEIIVYDFML